MGRTLATINQLDPARKSRRRTSAAALRREDQRTFDALFAAARKHTAAISQANHALPFEAMLLAILLEQAGELERLKRRLDE